MKEKIVKPTRKNLKLNGLDILKLHGNLKATLENAQDILADWNRKKKIAKSANSKLKVKLPTKKIKRSE